MLTEEEIKKFILIWLAQTGQQIEERTALKMANQLLAIVRFLLKSEGDP